MKYIILVVFVFTDFLKKLKRFYDYVKDNHLNYNKTYNKLITPVTLRYNEENKKTNLKGI